MPLIVEDDYYEIIREFTIPDRSVSSMTQAGSWSARNSRSGFVPSTVLADITDDPDRDAGPWIAAGVVKRAKGGVRFIGGRGMTVVNAADVEAKTARTRAANNERKQRSRERLRAEQAGKIHAALPVTDVTPKSHPKSADVTGGKAGKQKKSQVSAPGVTRDIGVTSRVTPGPSRAGARQDDFDLDPREGVSQSRSDARESDADDPELVTVVANAICAEASFLPGDDQARAVIRIFEDRARKAGTVIRSKPAYYAKVVVNEPDLWNGVLLPKPPPAAAESAPWASPALTAWDPEHHEFDPPDRGIVCRCGSTENSPRHYRARNECPA
jgi:hypothetical protein